MGEGGESARIAFLERQVRISQLLGGTGLLLGAVALGWLTLDAWTAPTAPDNAPQVQEWKGAKAKAKAKAKAMLRRQRAAGGAPGMGPRPPAQGGAAVRNGVPELQVPAEEADSPPPPGDDEQP